jgi:hypothetical protein
MLMAIIVFCTLFLRIYLWFTSVNHVPNINRDNSFIYHSLACIEETVPYKNCILETDLIEKN